MASCRPSTGRAPGTTTRWSARTTRQRRNCSSKHSSFSHTKPCRSEPARDYGVSAGIDVTETPLSRASSLPQGAASFTNIAINPIHCGSELARDSNLSAEILCE
ncbi:hypothetical protein C9I50_02695 [Pseudomonas prosekii]|nr:hypothetical protein C9I50_02695 [Pseudomonas prosekii]